MTAQINAIIAAERRADAHRGFSRTALRETGKARSLRLTFRWPRLASRPAVLECCA